MLLSEREKMMSLSSSLSHCLLVLLLATASVAPAGASLDINTAPASTPGTNLRGGSNRASAEPPTVMVPNDNPQCFQTNQELREAVKKYKNYQTLNAELASRYGWPIGNWCVGQLDDFSFVFQHQRKFNEPLTHWDTSRAVTMEGMFQDAQKFNQDLSHFNTSHVENMSNLFEAAIKFQGHGLERWNTASVTNMDFMFLHALAFEGDITHWQVHNVKSMKGVLKDARSFTQEQHLQVLAEWDFHHHVDMAQMSDFWIAASIIEEEETNWRGLTAPVPVHVTLLRH
jgi:surface protein